MSIRNKYISLINFIFFFVIIFFPHKSSYYFDGLPFLNKYETIFGILIIPFLCFFLKDFIFSKQIFFFGLIIFFIKVILSFSNQTGINVKQFFNHKDLVQDNFIKTYDTFWNNDVSAVQKFSWTSQDNFPLDWTHMSKINLKENNKDKYIDVYDDFKSLEMFYNFNFYLNIGDEKNIKIDFGKSSKIIKLTLKRYNFDEKLFNEVVLNDYLNNWKLSKGIYLFDIDVKYKGNDWKFSPYIYEEGKKKNLFKEKIIFTDLDTSKLNFLNFFKFFSNIYDYLIFLLFLLIFVIILSNIKKQNYIFIFLSILFFISYHFLDTLINYLLTLFEIVDGVGSFSFGISHLLMLNVFIFVIYKTNYKKLELHSFFKIISIPTCLFVFTKIFFNDLETFAWAGAGDDWTTFQEYSRQIVVDGKWLEAGEKVFYFRPGSRYIYAISHIIFGQSAFAFKMLNIWCIILCSFLVIKILERFNCNKILSNIAGVLLLSIYTADNFRWILVVGLSEYYSMIFLFIAFYLIIEKQSISTLRFIVICICGIVQIWLREEHVPVALSLIFLMKYSYNRNFEELRILDFYRIFISFCMNNKKIIILYFLIIISCFCSIFIRNYFYGGSIGLFNITAVKTLLRPDPLYVTYYQTFSRLIFGVDQYFPTMPKIYSIFNVLAILISFVVIINYRKYSKINFGLPIVLFATIFPYFLVDNEAYTPRYVIHLLPTSIIICFLYINIIYTKNEKNINYRI